MAISGGGFNFLPRSLTRRPDAQQIANALFKDKRNVLLKLQKKADRGAAVNWRSKGIPITHPDRMMPNEFFFLTELHYGGCGCYSSSDRWRKYGYHATAIGVR
ncbi:uncharacterized protein LOC144655036 [Oculina patagonica]